MNQITKRERRRLRKMLGTRHTRREATKSKKARQKGAMSASGKLAKLVHAVAAGQPVAFVTEGRSYTVAAAAK